MESNLRATSFKRQATSFLWRLSVLLLPWQIRWFSAGPLIDGYPWEQGRIVIYLSWIPMVALILLAIVGATLVVALPAADRRAGTRRALTRRWLMIGIGCLLVSSFFTLYWRSTIQWWLEVLILFGFVWVLYQLKISWRSLAAWFAISLIPHAILGIQQFITQEVYASKWLGMAYQHPGVKGTSVIQFFSARILRAYGGFPHPNIFAGWLAIAIPTMVWLISTAKRFRERIMWVALLVLFCVPFVLTFSRAAWLGCFIALVLATWLLGRGQKKKWLWIAFATIVISFGSMVFLQRNIILGRFQVTAPLEERSISERQQGFLNGGRLFVRNPIFGVGPGATAYALDSQIIPHFVPLLILDEVGIVGVLGLLMIIFIAVRRRFYGVTVWIPFFVIIFLGLFDHFPWSLWGGRSLTALAITVLFLSREGLDKPV